MKPVMIPLALAALGMAGPAIAQVWPTAPVQPGVDSHRYQVDRHRYEMDRLRTLADQREALTRRIQLETGLNRLEIEAARRPDAVQPQPYRALRSAEEARSLRLSAEGRRVATIAGVEQIDAWLDREPR